MTMPTPVTPTLVYTSSQQLSPSMLAFNKLPVLISPGSDSEVLSSDGLEQPRPISLLTTLLSDNVSPIKQHATANSCASGPSLTSSTPSTTVSSPGHDPVSILRRGSVDSEAEPSVKPTHSTSETATTVWTMNKKEAAPSVQRTCTLKFAVANPSISTDRSHIPAPIAIENEQEGNDTDLGYEEDSEDGFSEDEPSFMIHAHKMATQSGHQSLIPRRSLSPSPPPARTLPPPPPRRGRGHVRVDPAAGKDHKRCTRHQSPPPSATSDGRSAPPGPRDGRAGSPMPSRYSDDEDEEEEEDAEDEENEENEEEMNVTTAPFHDTYDEVMSDHSTDIDNIAPVTSTDNALEPRGFGVRDILRRASEHIPGFHRPPFPIIGQDAEKSVESNHTSVIPNDGGLLRSRSLGSKNDVGTIARSLPMSAPSANERMAKSGPVACPRRLR